MFICPVNTYAACFGSTDHLKAMVTYLLTYFLTSFLTTYSMEQSPSSEANRFSDSQEIPRILWNPKVPYCVYKCPPPVPILSHIDLLLALTTHFLMIHLNIILPSTPGSSKWSLSFRFLQQNTIYTFNFPHTCYMHRPPRSSRFDHPNNI